MNAPTEPALENSPSPDKQENPSKPAKTKRAPSNSRGPTPGKYQNGKLCFSAWLPTPFFVRLRRYAANLGTDIPSLLQNDYELRIIDIPLTDEDKNEIELSNKSLRQ